jgi:hypothetical protein
MEVLEVARSEAHIAQEAVEEAPVALVEGHEHSRPVAAQRGVPLGAMEVAMEEQVYLLT